MCKLSIRVREDIIGVLHLLGGGLVIALALLAVAILTGSARVAQGPYNLAQYLDKKLQSRQDT